MIPKNPPVPRLTDSEIHHISDIVFGSEYIPDTYDGIFVFGGTDPKRWEQTIVQYRKNPCKYIFVTGGRSKTSMPHNSWLYGDANESDVIAQKLIEAGIPEHTIIKECKSTNSLENILCIKDEICRRSVSSLVCVTSNHGVGRQLRTMKKALPEIAVYMSCFIKMYESGALSRDTWWKHEDSSSNVWGEYLRNYIYAKRGDIAFDFTPMDSLRKYLDEYEELSFS